MLDTKLIPILDPGKHFVKRSWMFPGLVTALCALGLAEVSGNPPFFLWLVSICICSVTYFFLDLLCHERKPFWVAALVALASYSLVSSSLLGYLLYPFRIHFAQTSLAEAFELPTLSRFGFFFVVAGLAEEFVKAVPLFGCVLMRAVPGRLGHAFGLRTPVDGILLGAASGIGFSLAETLGEYVPRLQGEIGGEGLALYAGLALAIQRLVGILFTHVAWAAYVGYFVGLAAARLSNPGAALLVGWLSAAILHGLWDCFAGNFVGTIIIAALSYCFLTSAVLEARRLHCPTLSTA